MMTDTNRWQFITIDKWERGAIKKMNVPPGRYGLKVDPKNLTLKYMAGDSTLVLQYQVRDSNHLIISGSFSGRRVYSMLSKKSLTDFLLISRGFHWINESPYNR